MKKVLIFTIIFLAISVSAFADFQINTDFGYFFNTDNYGSVKRSFNGIDLSITGRYLYKGYVGLFFSPDFKAWFSANNDEYKKLYESSGMRITIDDTMGFKLDLNMGLSLAYPITYKFGIQSDLGVSLTALYRELIGGDVIVSGYKMGYGIFPDKVSSAGFFISVFGRYLLLEQGGKHFIAFGLKIDRKFTRKESGEVIVGGMSQNYSGTETDFAGLAIVPFIGYTWSY